MAFRTRAKDPERSVAERSLGHCKACNVEDFAVPSLQSVIRDVYQADITPPGREDRKMWEIGMAVRALGTFGALKPDAELLGVGAGREITVFHLTRFVRRVFATDLYLSPGDWERTASTDMLGNPGQYWSNPWNERRLVVQHMDALDLRYEDGVFDGIFSSSSIEHFGSIDDVRRSLAEMCRVLKPGGICSISTELRIAGDGPGFPGTLLFSPDELTPLLLDGLPWELVEPLDVTVSPRTQQVVVDFAEASADVRAGRPQWSTYPHVLLESEGNTWTSVHVALRRRPEL
jgi:SAM-dependent methyltransferase